MRNPADKLRIIGIVVIAFGVAFGSAGLTAPQQAIAQDRVNVVATTGQVAEIARNVGGELVDVTALMGPGVDPHLYSPSEGDLLTVIEAELILYNGLNLEGQFGEVFESLSGEKTIVAVADAIPEDMLLGSVDYAGAYDPHVWFDPSLWLYTIDAVAAALSEIDGDNADTYAANAESYRTEIEEFDARATAMLDTVPEAQRVLITAHDAFGYFGDHFGYEVIGIQGISTESEAGVSDIQDVAGLIAERQIPAIFVESSVNARTVEAVQASAADQGFDVIIGGELYSDALGDADSPEGTYLGMFEHNVTTITEALGGDPSVAAATPEVDE